MLIGFSFRSQSFCSTGIFRGIFIGMLALLHCHLKWEELKGLNRLSLVDSESFMKNQIRLNLIRISTMGPIFHSLFYPIGDVNISTKYSFSLRRLLQAGKKADAKKLSIWTEMNVWIAVHSNILVLTQSMCINFYLKIHWNHTYFVPMEYLRLANTQTAVEMTFGFHFLCCTMQNSVHYGMEGFSRTRLSTVNGREKK